MTVDPDIPRRVAQVRHDVDELYELASGVDRKVDDLGGEVRGLQGDVRGLQGEVRGLQGEVQGLQGEVRGLGQTLDLHGGRLDQIEDNQRLQSQQLDTVTGQLGEILTALRGPAAGPDGN